MIYKYVGGIIMAGMADKVKKDIGNVLEPYKSFVVDIGMATAGYYIGNILKDTANFLYKKLPIQESYKFYLTYNYPLIITAISCVSTLAAVNKKLEFDKVFIEYQNRDPKPNEQELTNFLQGQKWFIRNSLFIAEVSFGVFTNQFINFFNLLLSDTAYEEQMNIMRFSFLLKGYYDNESDIKKILKKCGTNSSLIHTLIEYKEVLMQNNITLLHGLDILKKFDINNIDSIQHAFKILKKHGIEENFIYSKVIERGFSVEQIDSIGYILDKFSKFDITSEQALILAKKLGYDSKKIDILEKACLSLEPHGLDYNVAANLVIDKNLTLEQIEKIGYLLDKFSKFDITSEQALILAKKLGYDSKKIDILEKACLSLEPYGLNYNVAANLVIDKNLTLEQIEKFKLLKKFSIEDSFIINKIIGRGFTFEQIETIGYMLDKFNKFDITPEQALILTKKLSYDSEKIDVLEKTYLLFEDYALDYSYIISIILQPLEFNYETIKKLAVAIEIFKDIIAIDDRKEIYSLHAKLKQLGGNMSYLKLLADYINIADIQNLSEIHLTEEEHIENHQNLLTNFFKALPKEALQVLIFTCFYHPIELNNKLEKNIASFFNNSESSNIKLNTLKIKQAVIGQDTDLLIVIKKHLLENHSNDILTTIPLMAEYITNEMHSFSNAITSYLTNNFNTYLNKLQALKSQGKLRDNQEHLAEKYTAPINEAVNYLKVFGQLNMLPKLKDDILRLSGDLTDINTVINLFANASNYLNKYTVLGEWNNIWLEFYSKSFNNKLAPDLTDFINEQAIKIAAETTSAAQLDPLDMIRTKFWLADFQASVFIKLKEYIERDINLKLSFIHSSSAEFIASIKGKDNDISKAYWNLAKEDYPEGSDGFALLEAYFLYRDSALRLGEEFHEKIDKLDDCWHEDDTLNLFNNALIIYNDNDLLQGTLRFDLDNKDLSEQFINLNIRIGIDYLDKFNSYVELLCSTSSISAKFFCPLVKALYFDSAYLNAHTTYKLLENIDSPEYPELKEYKDKAPQEANYQLKEFLQQEGDYLTEAHAATNYLNDELKTKWAEAILPHLHAEQKFSLVYLLKSLGQDYEDTCDDLKKFIDDYQYDDSSLSWDNRFAEACTYTPST